MNPQKMWSEIAKSTSFCIFGFNIEAKIFRELFERGTFLLNNYSRPIKNSRAKYWNKNYFRWRFRSNLIHNYLNFFLLYFIVNDFTRFFWKSQEWNCFVHFPCNIGFNYIASPLQSRRDCIDVWPSCWNLNHTLGKEIEILIK